MDKTDYTRQVLNSLSLETKTIKNFTSAGNVPTWLAEGELAVNIIDQKLWVGNTLNTPILLINSATTPSAQGSNTQIQFNDGGVIGAHAGLTYNKATSTLTATNIVGLTSVTGNAGTATNVAYSGLTGIVPTWNQSTTGNALTSTTAGTVTTAAQPAITSVGILTGLTVNSTIAGSIDGNAATATNVAYSGLTGTPTIWNQNTTGTADLAIALTTTLPINKGGTGQTSPKPALDALLPSQTGKSGYFLKTNGVSHTWQPLQADADALEGTTLKSTVVNSSLTSVGTLASLTVTAPIGGSITGNAATATTAGTVTNPNLTGEVTTSGLTATVANSAVISKVLTGYTKSSGEIVSTDTILQAIQKLEGNVSTIDGGFPSDNYSNITTIDGGTP